MNPPLELAPLALAQYPLKRPRLTYLQHSENVTWLVETASEKYLLRLHSPITPAFGAHGADPAMVNSEMQWLAALQRAKFPSPAPIKNKDGQYVSAQEGWLFTLLRWREGELLTLPTETEEIASQMGSLVARLHAQTSRWKPPAGFTRPQREPQAFQQALAALAPAVDENRIAYRDFRALQTALQGLQESLAGLPRNRKTYGLMHFDLHRGNFLYHKNRLSLIDFSMSAYGYYLFDVANCLSNLRTVHHPAFLQAYAQEFPLPQGFETVVQGCFVANHIFTFALWINDPASQENLLPRISLISQEYAQRINRGEDFWF
jgi:Ser/Thr protein kinase RdoA (MazF antagonist)